MYFLGTQRVLRSERSCYLSDLTQGVSPRTGGAKVIGPLTTYNIFSPSFIPPIR